MLVLLLLYATTQSAFGGAIPVSSIGRRDPSGNGELIYTRTIWDIIHACFSTILLCTWASLHPNISSTPDEPGMRRRDKLLKSLVDFLRHKLRVFLWALFVPEYILAWAIRQYIMAGKVQKKGWTRTHGFFLIMGGFQLYKRPDEKLLKREENGVVCYSINPGEFVRILDMNDVQHHNFETITTEEDLKDRGKSDAIAKAIVLLQTLWFVVQCIARGFQQLPLTELEIITLAYTIINLAIYMFWWDKPRDARRPIRVYENVTRSQGHTPIKWESGFPGIIERVITYIVGYQDDYVLLSEKRKVPIFWSSRCRFSDHPTALLGPSILGMAFGAIHFIAWWHGFPSHTEFTLWRLSCIVLVAVPLLSAISCGFMIVDPDGKLLEDIGKMILFLLLPFSWLYVVARVATIVIAFTVLRSLPSEQLQAVDWTIFIPHI